MRLEIRFWIADPVNGVNNVRSDVNRAIWRIFRAHGVTHPRAAAGNTPAGVASAAPRRPGAPRSRRDWTSQAD